MRLPADPTVDDCMKELMPTLKEISRLILSAPIGTEGRQCLALNVMGHFSGTAMGAMQLHTPALKDMPDHQLLHEVMALLSIVMKEQLS